MTYKCLDLTFWREKDYGQVRQLYPLCPMNIKIIAFFFALAVGPFIIFAADAPAPATAPSPAAASAGGTAPVGTGRRGNRGAGGGNNSSGIFLHEGGAGLPAYPVMVRHETQAARAARMQWFHEARFGIFIHWGVYAVPARGEWYMNQGKVPVADYKAYAKGFTAAKYDPQAWAQLIADAGAKYMVITAKHHDGFTLYDSQYSDWNAVKASAAGRDLLQPLADAVRAKGIKFGLYYSQSQDWVNLGGGKGNAQAVGRRAKEGRF